MRQMMMCIDSFGVDMWIREGEVYEGEVLANGWVNVVANDGRLCKFHSDRFEIIKDDICPR